MHHTLDGCDVGAPWLPWLWRDRPVALTVVKRYVPDERSVTRSPARARRTVNTAGANTAEFTALRPRTRLAHLRDRGLSAEQLTRLRRGARCGGGPLPQGLSRVCLIAAIGYVCHADCLGRAHRRGSFAGFHRGIGTSEPLDIKRVKLVVPLIDGYEPFPLSKLGRDPDIEIVGIEHGLD